MFPKKVIIIIVVLFHFACRHIDPGFSDEIFFSINKTTFFFLVVSLDELLSQASNNHMERNENFEEVIVIYNLLIM